MTKIIVFTKIKKKNSRFYKIIDETRKNCTIKNLPENYKKDDLKNLLLEFGTPVSCKVFFDEKGRSEKYGICSMKTQKEAAKVVEGLNCQKIGELELNCCLSLSVDEIQKKLESYKPKEIQNYFKTMKKLQKLILNFLKNEEEITAEAKYLKLIEFIDQCQLDDHEFKSFLYIIVKISNNHFRNRNFYTKIFQILMKSKDRIKHFFSNQDMFNFFIDNKQILLFLVKEKIMIIDQNIAEKIINNQFLSFFFYPEIKCFPSCKIEISENDTIEFENKRTIGENASYICQLIRNDDIDDFIVYITKNVIQIDSQIKNSIFETNIFLMKNQPSLIEYSAFFGSIKIFNYLYQNEAKLTPTSWLYAIHGANPEIINILEEKKVNFPEIKHNKGVYSCLKESLKCHHKEISNYFINSEINVNSESYKKCITKYSFCYYNYQFISDDLNSFSIFKFGCKYDHYMIVKFLMPILKYYQLLKNDKQIIKLY